MTGRKAYRPALFQRVVDVPRGGFSMIWVILPSSA
jgi:hypothetical protein